MIKCDKLTKTYGKNESLVTALSDCSIDISQGEFVAIMGKSGAGKSTLLNILCGIISPSSGSVFVNNMDISNFSDNELARYRRREIGVIFQEYGLIDNYTVEENILLALTFSELKKNEKKEKINTILSKLDILSLKSKKISKLSGGEKQRVAIARAMINDPNIILADEPTGSLDSENAAAVMDILLNLHKQGKTILLITHDNDVASYAQRIITLSDGRIV
ncbi:MAG: ABC transporter ATP-binding protein [Clostridia bacterium]